MGRQTRSTKSKDALKVEEVQVIAENTKVRIIIIPIHFFIHFLFLDHN